MGLFSRFIKARTVFPLVLGLQVWWWASQSTASEPTRAAGLDAYVSQMGYEKVSFINNERNQPLVESEIKSRHHVFLADTGCRTTILTPAAASGLKTLGELGVTLQDQVLGSVTNPSVALIDKLVIGHGQFINQPALLEPLDMDYIRMQFDGILGLDFFFRNFCLMDCYRRELFLRATRPSPVQSAALETTLRRSGFISVPLKLERLLSIAAAIQDQPVRLLVDTGDSVSALDQSLAKQLNLSSVRWDVPAEGSLIRQDISGNMIGFGSIGSHKVWIAKLSSFQIGSRTWTNVPYGVANLSGWGLGRPGSSEAGLQGIFGNDWLRWRGAVLDFSNLKLWFRPERKA